jgi:aspartate aminotransferase
MLNLSTESDQTDDYIHPSTTVLTPMLTSKKPDYRRCLNKISPNVAAELLRYGRSKTDIISLAQGEGDTPTPDFICKAASEALQNGKTFYGQILGHPELRQEISNYYARIFDLNIPTSRVYVTASGTNAVHMALQSILDEGDDVVAVTPIWKNLIGIIEMAGAQLNEVCMRETDTGWTLDMDELFNAVTPSTKVILLVTPSNPTGWVMPSDQIKSLMEFARDRNIWIVSDEIYARCMYGHKRAPSFLDIAEPQDKLFVVNSFSKNWAMTGWRLGWLVGPAASESKIYDMALYEYMGPPDFTQYGGIAALRHGEDLIKAQLSLWENNMEMISDTFDRIGKIRYSKPDATFYSFFRIDGISDSMGMARRLIDEAGISLAPGCSFGSGCKDYLRLCFGVSPKKLARALDRFEKFCKTI